MTSANRSKEEHLAEIEDLRFRLEEAEETLRAIGNGAVDAFVVSGPEGDQIFTLSGAEHPYRVLVETMTEGAVTLAADGTILYCNNRLSALLHVPLEQLIGTQLVTFVASADRPVFLARMEGCGKDEINMITGTGSSVPVLISCFAHDLCGSHGMSLIVTDLTQQQRNRELLRAKELAEAASQAKSQRLANVSHELLEITARLKLIPLGKRSPEDNLRLCNDFREEVVALLDRLQMSTSIGAISDFDVHQVPFVKVDIVE
ncbi:MAG: PAS domain-containing hybrid sensor histidine kinase/response regulator [Deltaproteobacteria bacterium]|nr:MAG: PAS domain-containing hybrid sensor histidine kinase/response regulator [Deltaproteobacteria bacterium]